MIIQTDDKTSIWFSSELSRILKTDHKIKSIKQMFSLSDYDQTNTRGKANRCEPDKPVDAEEVINLIWFNFIKFYLKNK
jgi:hypothetical protein